MHCSKSKLSSIAPAMLSLPRRRLLSTTVVATEGVKQKVIILGVGWGGFRLAKDLDKSKFDVTVVSPRNHFLFTPLLPSTTVGTLEFRCVQEPVRTLPGVHFHHAQATKVDFERKLVTCRDVYEHYGSGELLFDLPYDRLAISVGIKSNTFGTPGVECREEQFSNTGTNRKSVFFLKQLQHARAIRNRIIECFERASSPFISEEERKRLLTFVVVGGGPTSIEFTSELCDFLRQDVSHWYTDMKGEYNVVVVEAGKHLLGTFDAKLSSYVEQTLTNRKVTLMTSEAVKEVRDVTVVLKSGKEIPFGVCVWSTGNTALNFVKGLGLPLGVQQRIEVDECLRVTSARDVYALGDCAADRQRPLAMLAQVANQQGIYLASTFNSGCSWDGGKQVAPPFQYKFMGAMASLGVFKAVADFHGPKLKGFIAFLAWRSAYWTMSVSITNKILIPMYWFKSFFFGRDISKF